MKHTTNYRLNLPDLADKFSIAHANENMTAIDTKFKQTDTKFTEVQASTTTQIATAKNQQTALLNSELSRLRKQYEITGINQFLVDYNTFYGLMHKHSGIVLETFQDMNGLTHSGNLSKNGVGVKMAPNARAPAISVNHSFPFSFKRIYFYILHQISEHFSFTPSASFDNGSTWQELSKVNEISNPDYKNVAMMYKMELPQHYSAIKIKLDAYLTGNGYDFYISAYGVYFDDVQ